MLYETILSYCLKCRKTTEGKNQKVVKTKHWWIILLLKFAVYYSKKRKFIKEEEARSSNRTENTDSNWFVNSKYFVLKV